MSMRRAMVRKAEEIILFNNVFIGGISGSVTSKSEMASKMRTGIGGSSFQASNIFNFTIVGDDIEFRVDINYSLRENAFINTTSTSASPTYYRDTGGKCTGLGAECFRASYNTLEAYFPNVTEVMDFVFYHGNANLEGIRVCYIPLCTVLGATAGANSVFTIAKRTSRIYIHPFLETNNGGNPDGDLTSAIGATISYVSDFTEPSSINDLATVVVYDTLFKIDWTAPSSTNAIEHYEIYIDDVFLKISADVTTFITGLNNSQTYKITVKAVDIFYNRSDSNIINVLVNGSAPAFPLANIISEWKMEDNAFDHFTGNNGIETAITYANGLVNRTAVYNGSTSQILIKDYPNLSFGNGVTDVPFSISLLVKFDVIKQSMLLDKRDDALGANQREYYFYYNGTSLLFRLFDQSTGANLDIAYPWTPTIGVWYHLMATYDGSGNLSGLKQFIDGVSVGSRTPTGSYTAMENGTGEVSMGFYKFANLTLQGQLDCLRLWNIEYSDVLALATAELAGTDITQ